MDKKKIGGLAALVSAMLYGGAQLFDLEARLVALEGLHPELGVPDSPKPQDGSQEPASPEPTEEPDEKPESAPDAEHMELNEDDEWVVPAEEATEGEG